jgi:hypothetical protein
MVNLSRAKDAAIVIANRDPARHNDRLFRWEPESENALAACAGASNAVAGVLEPREPENAPPATTRREAAE